MGSSISEADSQENTQNSTLLREIAFLAVRNQFVIKARHIAGVTNRVPDWLSRWGSQVARRSFHEYAKDKSLKRVRIHDNILQFEHKW